MEMFSLKGRRALVTGSSRGIGREILLCLARAGADVVAHGVSGGELLKSAVNEAKSLGVEPESLAGDLSVDGGGKCLAQAVLAGPGPVDILVLNASMQIRAAWENITPEEFSSQMRANFQASLEIIQTLVPPMREKQWGRILTVGSVQQVRPHPDMLVYSASKAAQMNMVLSLAKQLAADGITVNNLAPGVILTDRNSEVLSDPAYADKVKEAVPAGYFGEPRDCAGAALLLCSEEGRYITGQNLTVDGGLGLP